MIAQATSVSYGANILNYIDGQSRNKKEPDKIHFVCNQFLPDSLSAAGIFQSMETDTAMYRGTGHRLSKTIKRSVIKFEISPSPEYTKGWGIDDWKKLWDDYVREFDRQVLYDKNGKVKSAPTNIRGSKAAVRVHYDSKSGVPHLHAVACRVDRKGNINNSHELLERSQKAADAVAIKRGWKTAIERGQENKKMLLNTCYGILRQMPRWDWSAYQSALESKGYTVNVNQDTTGVVRGYSIKMGNSVYPSSKIHASIKPKEIQGTWRKLRSKVLEEQAKALARQKAEAEALRRSQERAARKPQSEATSKPHATPQAKPQATPTVKPVNTEPPYSRIVYPCARYDLKIGGQTYTRYIPLAIHHEFTEGLDARIMENTQEITHTACALFLGLIVPPQAHTGGVGGGGSNDQSPWGRDPREDEIEWARRCALMAHRIIPARKRSTQQSLGYHR